MKRITSPTKVYFSKEMRKHQSQENIYEIMSKLSDKKKTYYLETTFGGQKKLFKVVNWCMKAKPTDGYYLECQICKTEGVVDFLRADAYNEKTYKITWDLVEKK